MRAHPGHLGCIAWLWFSVVGAGWEDEEILWKNWKMLAGFVDDGWMMKVMEVMKYSQLK